MRRALLLVIALVLLTASSAGSVAAAQPDHSRPGALPPIEFAAGEVCPFALTLSTTEDLSKTSVWEFEDGTIRILSRGYAEGFATNTDADISLRNAGGYRIDVTIHPDGSADVHASGVLFGWYFPGENVEGLSAGAFAVRGHGTEHYAPDGSLASARFYGGRVVNLCEALAA